VDNDRDSVTFVHKGNIMKFTEGAFKEWGYEVARDEFGAELLDGGPWMQFKNPNTGKNIVVKDAIADAMLQQILLRPAEYDVIATLNLNGDYLSDALAAEVGGIRIAPGANLSDTVAMFEATHGTAPKYAGQDKVNPGSLILSAEMMLRHMGWVEAADLIIKGTEGAIAAKTVTYDFERLMEGAQLMSCSLVRSRRTSGVDRGSTLGSGRSRRFGHGLLRPDVGCVEAFRTLQDIEHDRLPSFQSSVAFHLDGRVVGEQVLIAAVCYDEAVAFGVVEPLDLTA